MAIARTIHVIAYVEARRFLRGCFAKSAVVVFTSSKARGGKAGKTYPGSFDREIVKKRTGKSPKLRKKAFTGERDRESTSAASIPKVQGRKAASKTGM
jgi:hypothetical protein